MLRSSLGCLSVVGLSLVFANWASEVGAWTRSAPLTTCEINEDHTSVHIELPYSRDNEKDVLVEPISENKYEGVSEDGVLVSYELSSDGDNSCNGQKHRPELAGLFQWAELKYEYQTQ